jgi:hypothetical protein
VAADDLVADPLLDVGHVEGASLGGQLGVEDDLQVEIAELIRQVWSGAAVERVVDLVGLFEQMLLERRVSLLAIPRAAVGTAQPGRDPGQGPGAGQGALRRQRGQEERPRQGGLIELADGRGFGHADTAHDVVGGVEPP